MKKPVRISSESYDASQAWEEIDAAAALATRAARDACELASQALQAWEAWQAHEPLGAAAVEAWVVVNNRGFASRAEFAKAIANAEAAETVAHSTLMEAITADAQIQKEALRIATVLRDAANSMEAWVLERQPDEEGQD